MVSFLFLPKVAAATIEIGDDSTTAGALNKSVPLELKDSDLKDYNRVEFELSISGTTYADIEFSYKGNLDYSRASNVYIISSETGLYATTLGEVSYKTTNNLNSDFTIALVNVKFYKPGDEKAYTVDDTGISVVNGKIKYVIPKSTDATLTDLVVSQGTLKPDFSPEVTDYEVSVSDTINSIRITANPAKGASRVGTGSKTLSMGANTFEIEVTAEDGSTKKIYTIVVNRGEIVTPSAYLKKLYVDNIGLELSPSFDKNNNKYTISVPFDMTELNLKYESEDKNAKVEIVGNEKFVTGENRVIVKVTANDESETQEYEIQVTVLEKDEETIVEEPTIDEKEKDEKKVNKGLIIFLIAFGIIAIVSAVAILLFKKKKGNNSKKNSATKSEEASIKGKADVSEDKSVTDILKGELYDEHSSKTETYDVNAVREAMRNVENDDKTKEFDFKDFK